MPQQVQEAYDALGISPITARLLYGRNILPDQAADFLAPDLDALNDPFLFENMRSICDRLLKAVDRQEQTVIYGDYDCDGVCGSVILKKTLDAIGLPCRVYLPDRATEGYGTNHAAFERLIGEGTQLFVTVDCGIRSNEDVAFAKERGIDVIILDHHECGEELPDTPYILNGKKTGEPYPYPYLCGAGVAFKLAQALLGTKANRLLEFAGIATIADMVPLTGENRILAYYGLQNLKNNPSMGIKSLMAAAGIKLQTLDEGSVGFGISPRINAAGRLAHGSLAVDLLLCEDAQQAMQLASELNALNEKRQALQKGMIAQAEQKVKDTKDLSRARVLMIAQTGWDKGVVGLAAASVAATFHRPTVVLSEKDGMLTGSARSLPGINLYELLRVCEQKYHRFGGHEMAAGLTFPAELLPEIEEAVNAAAAERYEEDAFLPTVYYDIKIELEDIDNTLAEQIQALRPFGQDNAEPVFLLKNYKPTRVSKLGDGSHLKMQEKQADILWFRAAQEVQPDTAYDLTANLNVNEFRGKRTNQLIVRTMQRQAPSMQEVLRYCAQTYMRAFPAEIEALAKQQTTEGPENIQKLFEEIQRLQKNSVFGTVIFVGSVPGMHIVSQLKSMGLEMRECLQLQPNDAQNCICYGFSAQNLQNYNNIVLIGCFSADLDGISEKNCFNYAGECIKKLYRQELEQYMVWEDQLMSYAKALYTAGAGGFSTLGELLRGAAELLQTKNFKKVWFAWKVCTQQKLLQMRKNDKIYVTFNDIKPNWSENTLLNAAKMLLS